MNIAAITTIIFTSLCTGLRAEVCTTAGCWEMANWLNNSMDLTVDPCDDMYQFVCGNYINRLDVSDTLYDGLFMDISREVRKKARAIFEVNSTDADPEWLKKVKTFYNSCKDTERLDKFSIAKMKTFLVKSGGWPVLDQDWNETDFNWVDVVRKVHAAGVVTDQLIDVSNKIDDDDLQNNPIILDSRNHDLNSWAFGDGMDGLQTYLKALVRIAVIFGAEKERAEQDMHEVVLFEIALANLSKSYLGPVPTTIAELQKAWPYVSWLDLIQIYFEDDFHITENQNVSVKEDAVDYLANLGGLLNNTPNRVLANYIMTRVVFANGLVLNEEIRNLYLAIVYDDPPTRAQTCYGWAENGMRAAVSAVYIRNYFTPQEKDAATGMTDMLREELLKIIENTDWLSNNTKIRAIKRVKNIALEIGYPDELANDTFLNDYYKDIKICPFNLWRNRAVLRKWNEHLHNKQLHKLMWNKWDYDLVLQGVLFPNAYLVELGPTLIAYASALEGLQYSADRPLHVNLATLGATLAHELTHSVDGIGRKINEFGQYEDWWDSVSDANYKRKEKAVADVYSTYVEETVNMTLNGTNDIHEIVADQGGFKIARNVMDVASQEYPSLPGLERFTAEQMFWITLSTQYCSKTDPRATKYIIRNDVHPLDKWRIRGPLRNSPQFAVDFGCPEGSLMNPKEKFNVW